MTQKHTTYRKYWTQGHNPIFTAAEVKNGIVTDAWVDQIWGNATGNASNYIGKTAEALVAEGFEKYVPHPYI